MESTLKEVTYLSDRYSSKEQLEAECEFWDATTAQWVGDCPRRAEYSIRHGLIPKGESAALYAGRALHAALAVYYATGSDELALAELESAWEPGKDYRLPPQHKYAHLHYGHLEVVLKNYLVHARKRDTFSALKLPLDALDLTDVLAAVWKVTPEGLVVFGECKLVMRFDVEGNEFVYVGKPDLPVRMSGTVVLMDHKSTNSYLSDWWADQHRFSNQLRGYCKMFSKIVKKEPPSGAMINGLYIGSKAASSEFKGTKFARFGPYPYQPSHLDEAIRNQYHWRKLLDVFEAQGYYPQHASRMCSGCPYADICEASVATRPHVIQQRYTKSTWNFLNS